MPAEASATALHRHAQRGWMWSGIEQFAQRGLSVIVSLVLARLLEPSAFGLIASVSVFLTTAQQLIDGGIGSRIVQKKVVSEEDYLALFWCNGAMSVLSCGLLILLSRKIAGFYGDPMLQCVVVAMAVAILLMNAGRVQENRMVREMRFKALSLITMVSVCAGSVVGLAIALLGGGIWALLGQQLVISLMRAASFWIILPWRPAGLPGWAAVKDLYSFGLPIMVSQTIRGFSEQLINVLGARFAGMAPLGYYDRGRFIPGNATIFAHHIFFRTNFTVLSRLQHDDEEFKKSYVGLLATLATLCAIGMAGLAVCAPEIIEVLLGAKWLPSVWFFRAGCLMSPLFLLFLVNLDVLKARGAVAMLSWFNIGYALLQVAGVAAGLHWGIEGMVAGSIVAGLLACMILMRPIALIGRIPVGTQCKVLLKALLWALATGSLLAAVKRMETGLYLRFVSCALAGGALFALAVWKVAAQQPKVTSGE